MEEQQKIIGGVIAFVALVIIATLGIILMTNIGQTQCTAADGLSLYAGVCYGGCNRTHTFNVSSGSPKCASDGSVNTVNYSASLSGTDEYNNTMTAGSGITSYSNMFPTIAITFIAVMLLAIVIGAFYFMNRQ